MRMQQQGLQQQPGQQQQRQQLSQQLLVQQQQGPSVEENSVAAPIAVSVGPEAVENVPAQYASPARSNPVISPVMTMG